MLLYDVSHTSHSRARTGVQRVALELRKALAARAEALGEVTYDPHSRAWRFIRDWERCALDTSTVGSTRRGAYWPWPAQLRGNLERFLRRPRTEQLLPANASGFFTAEIFTRRTGQNLPELFRHLDCPKAALFHDAISLRRPDLAPPSSVGRFPTYLAELLDFDGIMAVSEDSRQSLVNYWEWAGWKNRPEVGILPVGMDHLKAARQRSKPTTEPDRPNLPTVLCVGSLEGRKNHLCLLQACELLWSRGIKFELQMIGTLQRETGRTALNRLRQLQQEGRPLRYHGWLSDEALQQAFARCVFTVYPSLLEGFGLPVWESLLYGKPCVCSCLGPTGETARGGGCLAVDTRSPETLADGIAKLLSDEPYRRQLTAEARHRKPPKWADSAEQLVTWMATLPRRNRRRA